jgi:uncharacterized protein YcfJ
MNPMRSTTFSVVLSLTMLLGACTAPASRVTSVETYPAPGFGPAAAGAAVMGELGYVQSVDLTRSEETVAQSSGAGALIGGIAGAVVGHQVGGGLGKDLATVAGAVGGALVGNSLERSNSQRSQVRETYRVSVQMDLGGTRYFEYAEPPQIRIGDRVRVQSNQLFRY